ncbi:MAG: glycosyltransferase family 39 protein [Deltaproteobacteria bacterium]|nr:glycosyltransferase family 39 protein [Deltaproteobacteria bacterium]
MAVERPSDLPSREVLALLKPHRAWAGLALVLLLGFLARVQGLLDGLWFNEVFWVRTATAPFRGLLTLCSFTHVHPPLYALVLKAWLASGVQGDLWLRISSLAFGLGSIAVLYLWATPRFGSFAGLMGSLYLALSTFHAHFSVELGPLSLVVFLILVMVWMADRWLDDPTRRWPLGILIVAEVALVLSHPLGPFMVAGVALGGFAVHLPGPRHLAAWTVAHGVAVAATSWWLPMALLQQGHLPAPAFREVADGVSLASGLAMMGPGAAHPSPTWAWLSGALSLAGAGLGLLRGLRSPQGSRESPESLPRAQSMLAFSRPIFLALIASLILAIVLPVSQIWFTMVSGPHLDLLIGALGKSYLVTGLAFAALVGLAMIRQRTVLARRVSLPALVIAGTLTGLGLAGNGSPQDALRDLLPAVAFLGIYLARGIEARHWTTALVTVLILLALAAPSILAAPEAFLPRQDLRACAKALQAKRPGRPAEGTFVIPMWDRGGLEYYLGDGSATGIMSPADLPPAQDLPGTVNIVLTRQASEAPDLFARAFTARLGDTHDLDSTVRYRRVHLLRFSRH